MRKSEKIGPELIGSILKNTERLLTTKELHEKTKELIPYFFVANIILLNSLGIRETIRGKHTEVMKWVW